MEALVQQDFQGGDALVPKLGGDGGAQAGELARTGEEREMVGEVEGERARARKNKGGMPFRRAPRPASLPPALT